MPLKVNVGLSQKIGLPDYGSLGATCHVEYEADSSLLTADLETFQRQVKNAFIACKQAVQDELQRQQSNRLATSGKLSTGNSQPGRRAERQATHSQVRALEAIGQRLQIDLNRWLQQKFGLAIPAELTLQEASRAIDELKTSAPAAKGVA